MSNDLDVVNLAAGEIEVYNPGQPLAPMSHDSWANGTGVDLLHEHQHAPTQITIFGTAMPAGTTEAQVQATLSELGTHFVHDMGALKYPANLIGFAVKFFKQSALKPPRQVRVNHNFELPSELMHDWMANDFCNCLEGIAGTKLQKAQFLGAAIKWLAKVVHQLGSQQNAPEGSGDMPRTAPSSSSESMLNQLSDSDYNKVIKINEQAQINSLATLAAKHGQYTAQNMVALAQAHLEKLTPRERQHFDQFTTVNGVNWVHILNCAETIEFLYNASIGSGTLPTSGAAISAELKEIEALLATPIGRRKYFADPTLQARYRTLLDSVK